MAAILMVASYFSAAGPAAPPYLFRRVFHGCFRGRARPLDAPCEGVEAILRMAEFMVRGLDKTYSDEQNEHSAVSAFMNPAACKKGVRRCKTTNNT